MNFEALFRIAVALEVPSQSDQRQVRWLDDKEVLGLSRQPNGAYEIFLRGDQIVANSALVRRHLRHDLWRGRANDFAANRIALPADEHYQPVAAFLAEELLRNGLTVSMPSAFARSEPIIEMALRRAALSDEIIIGLLGELLFLNVLLSQASSASERGQVLESWVGFRGDSRDFVTGGLNVEIKTTRSARSEHHINGIQQVDPRRDADGNALEELYLLSIGLIGTEADDTARTFTLPYVIDEALRMLGPSLVLTERTEAQQILLDRIRSYAGSAVGYEHDVMRTWPAYLTPYQQGHIRIYNMEDDAIRVLRMEQMRQCDAVVSERVQFDIYLPEQVRGDINPEVDIIAFAQRLLSEVRSG